MDTTSYHYKVTEVEEDHLVVPFVLPWTIILNVTFVKLD
jgi:hypothetical protein